MNKSNHDSIYKPYNHLTENQKTEIETPLYKESRIAGSVDFRNVENWPEWIGIAKRDADRRSYVDGSRLRPSTDCAGSFKFGPGRQTWAEPKTSPANRERQDLPFSRVKPNKQYVVSLK